MVQIIKGGSEQQQAKERIGYTQGKNLSDTLTNFGANKALSSILKDPKMQNASPSEKMGALQQALEPYGQKGMELLQKRIQVEQMAQQEKLAKEQNIKGDILRRRLSGEPISEKEKSQYPFSPAEELAIQKHIQTGELGRINAGGKLTQASQPINPEQLNNIQMVRKMPGYEQASPAKKYQMLTDNNVSKENAEAEAKIAADDLKNQPGGKFAEEREKAVAKYVTDSFEKGKEANDMNFTIGKVKKAVNGEITGPGVLASLKKNPYTQILMGLTVDEAALETSNKYMLEGTKGIWGAKPTEREMMRLLDGMLPSIGKTKEANLAGLEIIEEANNLKQIHADLVSKITEGGSKYVPDVENQVNKAMKPIIDSFHEKLLETEDKFGSSENTDLVTRADGKIKVTNAKGEEGWMSPDKIEQAKKANIIFTPVKKK